MTPRKAIRLFFIKLVIAWKILFVKKHGMCIYITKEQLIEIIKDNKCTGEIELSYFGLMKHQTKQIIITASERLDHIEIALDKAAFEADVILKNKNNKK